MIQEFLSALYESKPSTHRILIWTLPDKRSHWTTTVDDAVHQVETLTQNAPDKKAGKDIYFGVGTVTEQLSAYQRGKAHQIAGIPGLWADIDLSTGDHKKANLFDTWSEIEEMLGEAGVEPTMVVHSGGGYHLYWLFKEFWEFESKGERLDAANLVARWNYTLQAWAERRGKEIDATFDLSRVLRVAGTYNYKRDPVQVALLKFHPERRYTPDDFEPFIPEDIEIEVTQNDVIYAKNLSLNPNANPPFDKFNALMENSKDFKDTWAGDRPDMSDTSPSAYDLSLATRAAFSAWSDQEITDLLIAKRRKNGEDLKLREDYYTRTIQ